MHWQRSVGCFLALATLASAAPVATGGDPINPSCPAAPGWATFPVMRFTLDTGGGGRVLRAEGVIDEGAATRLAEALTTHAPVEEIWLSSPGGNALVGNEAGRLIRKAMIPTRIPSGAACFSACNFIFMGGPIRSVDPGGLFIVHMFTHTADRALIDVEVSKGSDATVDLIGEIEQSSAVLATEDNDFLIRMGVSRKLLSDVMYQQKAIETQGKDRSTRRCLTTEELKRYNVVNL
ncbi:MAG TPA: hypothetical protein VFR36_09300 [Sphingomicrobium sp.]|nr:hypothetical protein [Sphingomicrobium sp.]